MFLFVGMRYLIQQWRAVFLAGSMSLILINTTPAQYATRPSKDLVRMDEAIPGIIIDLRYATERNITGKPFYPSEVAWIRPETARKLSKVQKDLKKYKLQLVIWDTWRPVWAQHILWDAYPDENFVSPPGTSRHGRGTTVDVGLADLKGNLVPMPTDFDVFTKLADHHLEDVPQPARRHTEILRALMFKHGFSGVPAEWWHYDLRNWKDYAIIEENELPARAVRPGA
jgi:D-alanyl-D-alanine dipeptidase